MQQLSCSVCSKYLFGSLFFKIKCNKFGCCESLLLCRTDHLAMNRCNICKIWKHWSCRFHFRPCVICKSTDNIRSHSHLRQVKCDICKFAVQVEACCYHEHIVPFYFRKCFYCQWILCYEDRIDCKGCYRSYCFDHIRHIEYCNSCILNIRTYSQKKFPMHIVQSIVGYL
jgi:hypothetical protein